MQRRGGRQATTSRFLPCRVSVGPDGPRDARNAPRTTEIITEKDYECTPRFVCAAASVCVSVFHCQPGLSHGVTVSWLITRTIVPNQALTLSLSLLPGAARGLRDRDCPVT